MPQVFIEIPSPLSDCITFCEIECVLACCGISAVSTDPVHVDDWCRQAGSAAVIEARLQLATLIDVVEDRSSQVVSMFLNHRTHNEASRRELLDFLTAIEAGLKASDAS
ncbi:DUF6331 family protein [Catelliglobosispora koreensis]|uniref:DUF6331 family protein n=1 Tax=Catelliglobosispora koreensis TaxID=129052 RepID=UPI00047634C7|nr:DUF6331 family protein [Catelliglobosispora koreensis]